MTDRAIEIVLLADRTDLIPTIGRWHWDEWGAGAPNVSLADWTDGLRARCGRGQVPTTWAALVDVAPVGSVALIEQDMPNHRELTPWLSSVFVVPHWRGQGVGSALVAHAEEAARRIGIARLYLYTDTAEPLYARRGWDVIGREHYDRSMKAIMAKNLTPEAPPG